MNLAEKLSKNYWKNRRKLEEFSEKLSINSDKLRRKIDEFGRKNELKIWWTNKKYLKTSHSWCRPKNINGREENDLLRFSPTPASTWRRGTNVELINWLSSIYVLAYVGRTNFANPLIWCPPKLKMLVN